jgi:conjugal transfer pilus assembly protein TraF
MQKVNHVENVENVKNIKDSEKIKKIKKIREIKKQAKIKSLFLVSVSCFVLLFSTSSHAAYRAQGWSWYNSAVVDYTDDDEQLKQVKEVTVAQQSPMSYSQQLAGFQAYYKEVYDKALITQNVEDVAYAAQLNKWMMEQSKGYGRAYKEALLKYPELSHELKFPTAQVARQVAYQEQKKEETRAIEALSEKYGLFYFYRGGNAYDQAMAASVQDLADQYHIALIGFPVDGKALKAIKNNHVYTNQMQTMGVKALPALFLVDPVNKKSKALAYGFIAQDDVKQHYVDIATDFGREKI